MHYNLIGSAVRFSVLKTIYSNGAIPPSSHTPSSCHDLWRVNLPSICVSKTVNLCWLSECLNVEVCSGNILASWPHLPHPTPSPKHKADDWISSAFYNEQNTVRAPSRATVPRRMCCVERTRVGGCSPAVTLRPACRQFLELARASLAENIDLKKLFSIFSPCIEVDFSLYLSLSFIVSFRHKN